VSASQLLLLAAASFVAGLVAAALWGWARQDNPAGVALVGASAFAAGAAAARRTLAAPRGDAPIRHHAALEELAAARSEVVAARAEVDALQTSVAHDLRSPVGAILNFVTVLELDHGPRLDDDARQIMRRIRGSAEAGLSLLDALSRLAGVSRAPFRPASVEIEPLVRRAFAEARAGHTKRELSVGTLPARAYVDADLMRAAFAELFDNALKFSGGRPAAQIEVGGRTEADGSQVYWVSDDGVGFDMRFAAKLFRIFERLHGRDEFPGTGIGLAIVRKVVERHGGRAWAEGAPEHGARVFLSLPGEPLEKAA
jgi:light-regulated signal transduction histidine kinase (bacteriophytochrome)